MGDIPKGQERLRRSDCWNSAPNATILSCACKQPWKARGCQPRDQLSCVEALLEWNCDPNLTSDKGNTVMMEMAGAGNVAVFKYFYERIMQNYWMCDLDTRNDNGRNLWSIAGLAHEDKGLLHMRPSNNAEIKAMIRDLESFRYVKPGGLATPSTANRANKRRIEERCVDVPGEAASSSSRRPPSPVTNESKSTRKPGGLPLVRMRSYSSSSE